MRAGVEADAGAFDDHALDIVALERGSAPFDIWMVTARPLSVRALSLASPEERARAARFRFATHRDRYLAAHVALRLLVERRFALPAPAQHYAPGRFGKPRLRELPDVAVNISYAGDRALVAIACGRAIGVDIERIRPIEDAGELARHYYTARENAVLARHERPGAAFDRMFLKLWTRKEACVKALGAGLTLPLSGIDTGIEAEMATVRVGQSQLRTGTTRIDSGYVAAWARLSGHF